jgi:uncharacterized protein
MCGPLVLAFPARRGGLGSQLAYNLGRITTYTLIGAALGGISAGLARVGGEASLAWTLRIQLGFSLVAALFLGVFGLSKLGLLREPAFLSLANPGKLPGFRRLQHRLAASSQDASQDPRRSSVMPLVFLGLLLGLLPCGLSFAAFARSLGAPDPLWGAAMTLAFGLGTLPSLLLVGLSASRLSAGQRRISDLVAGLLMIGMAVSLALDFVGAL